MSCHYFRYPLEHAPSLTSRHRASRRIAVLLMVLLSACDSGDMIGIPEPTQVLVDTSPVWSPNGTAVAYYRFFPSSAGPPGIYLIQSDGTNNQLIMESSVWTRDLRFSPDSTRLSMTIGLEIYILDLQDRMLRRLTSSKGNAEWGDWSPDSQFLVYSGPFIRPGQPDDGGLHIIEVVTGTDHRLFHKGARVYGRNPRWSPLGEPIAFWAINGTNSDVFTIRSDGSELLRVTNSNSDSEEDPRWFYGGSHLLYYWSDDNHSTAAQTRIMRADGSEQSRWPVFIAYYDAISPDSRYLVTHGAQHDSLVLFIRDIGDAEGTSLRQLTTFSPPPPSASASISAPLGAMEGSTDVFILPASPISRYRIPICDRLCGTSPRAGPNYPDH
jgi:Tol biopolymer transport system component